MKQSGLTLIELLVSLAILSLLASAALPYAETTVTRDKELELRRALRQIRTAIDRFHDDWARGKVSRLEDVASEDGYPRTLAVLVEGVPQAGARDRILRYLRRVPRDPFAGPTATTAGHWRRRGYQDRADAPRWGGADVYDVSSRSDRMALDGTAYADW